MRALHLATRLAGTDGVSLEAWKVARVLHDAFGFEPAFCAGDLADVGDAPHAVVPEMHLRDPAAAALGRRAFTVDAPDPDPTLNRELEAQADVLAARLSAVFDRLAPDLLVLQNVWAIPMQLPLAAAVARVVEARDLPVLSHEHDYPWERDRFAHTRIPAFLETYFPYHRDGVRHLCIHTAAREALQRRRGLDATVVPNVLDFDAPAPGIDDDTRGLRADIGIAGDARLFLQPTRVVPRKGIELAVDLLARRADPRDVLIVPHDAGDEGHDYLAWLRGYAEAHGVAFRHVADRVAERRGMRDGRPVYALWDVYPHADFVTYPSYVEGFGNALLEAVWFRKPALVNRYPVYVRDIAPKGFDFVEIDGQVDDRAVREVGRLLGDPAARDRATKTNLRVARRHFSLRTLEARLAPNLRALGFTA